MSLHSSENQMSDSNLAIVFGPNLVWSRDASASLAAMAQINSFVATVLFNYEDIFASVLDEKSAIDGELNRTEDVTQERTDGDGENDKELSSVEDKTAEAWCTNLILISCLSSVQDLHYMIPHSQIK